MRFKKRHAGTYVSECGRYLTVKCDDSTEWKLYQLTFRRYVEARGELRGTEILEFEIENWIDTLATKRDCVAHAAYCTDIDPNWNRLDTSEDHLMPRWARLEVGLPR